MNSVCLHIIKFFFLWIYKCFGNILKISIEKFDVYNKFTYNDFLFSYNNESLNSNNLPTRAVIKWLKGQFSNIGIKNKSYYSIVFHIKSNLFNCLKSTIIISIFVLTKSISTNTNNMTWSNVCIKLCFINESIFQLFPFSNNKILFNSIFVQSLFSKARLSEYAGQYSLHRSKKCDKCTTNSLTHFFLLFRKINVAFNTESFIRNFLNSVFKNSDLLTIGNHAPQ